MNLVVRRIASGRHHVMDVTSVTPRVIYGRNYFEPPVERTVCGVLIGAGVVMREGTPVNCAPCRHLSKMTEQPAWNPDDF